MVILKKALLGLVVSGFISSAAQAGSFDDNQLYIGAKAGQFISDSDLDNNTSYGAYGGYKFTPELGVEVEYVGSSDKNIDSLGFDIDYNFTTYGIYGTYNYTFPNNAFYTKAKLGLAEGKIDFEANGYDINYDDDNKELNVAGGIGLGYSIHPKVAIEAEYAFIAQDLSLLTVGANFTL